MTDDNQHDEMSKIIREFEKLQELSGEEVDENYQKYLDTFIKEAFEDMDDDIVTMRKMKKIKVKKLHEDAILPSYNYPSDSGFDLYSVEDVTIEAFGRALIPTGLSFQFDEGYEIQMRPKSGLSIKQGLTILNTPGTIDQGYSGEIKAIVFNANKTPFTIPKGMKIAQAVLCPVVNGKFVEIEEVESFEVTDRGDNGFGSTNIF